MMQDMPGEERSLGDLFGDLTRDLTTLIRQEASLARTEMGAKAAQVGKDVGFIAAGGAVAYAGLLGILGAIVALLAQAMPVWGAALIVGVIVMGVGGFLVSRGLSALKRADLTPHAAIEALTGERSESHGRAPTRRAVL